MNAKLRIKTGTAEVEFEGSEDFLKNELPEILKAMLELRSRSGEGFESEDEGGKVPKKGQHNTVLSTSTAAAKLGAKSGSDLVLAAAAALVIGGGKESFTRAELLSAMQSAKSYYKTTFRSNLSNYITTLIRSQDLLDHGGEKYGLHDRKQKELEKSLA